MVGSISQFPTFPSTTSSTSGTSSSSSGSSSSSTTNPQQSQVANQALSSSPSTVLGGLPVSTSGAGLLGTGGASSLLGEFDGGDDSSALFGSISTTQSELITQIEATANKRLQDDIDAINNEATDQTNGLNIQSNRWIQVKASINNAQIYVTNGQDAATKVANTLLDMRTSIANTDQPGEDPSFWQQQFDSQVNSINNTADAAPATSNLVGAVSQTDFSPNQIQYRNNLGTGVTTLNGTYIGSNFRIVGNDGTIWQPDVDSDTITAYAALGDPPENYTTTDGQTLEKTTSTRDGLKLVSYDPTTQDITVDVSIVPTDPPITVTGKLQTSGIGVMESWFYNDFATSADRQRAFNDINTAEANLTSAQATLAGNLAQVQNDSNQVTQQLNSIGTSITNVQNAQQTDTQAAEVKAAQQYLAMKANLQNLQSVQSNYLDAFSGFVDDPFAQASLSLIA